MNASRIWVFGSLVVIGGVGLTAACVGDTPINVPDAGTTDTGAPDVGGGKDGSADVAPDVPITCNAPTTNCGNVCVDLSKDPLNCGKCGRSCLGGGCTTSKCAVLQVASGLSNPYVVKSATTPDVLVVGSADPASDAGASGGLFRVTKPTGTPTRMWTAPSYVLNGNTEVALDGPLVYAVTRNANTTAFSEIDLNGSPSSSPSGIAISGINNQYRMAGAITTDAGAFRASGSPYQTFGRANFDTMIAVLSTGGAQSLVLPSAPYVVIADNSSQKIIRCPRTAPMAACTPSGGTAVYTGALASSASFLQSVGDTLYWANTGTTSTIVACTLPTCATPVVIASNEADVGGLAVDATGAYWTDPISGRIRACTNLVSGCAAASETRVDAQVNATGITTDGAAIYWTIKAPAGFVRRIGK